MFVYVLFSHNWLYGLLNNSLETIVVNQPLFALQSLEIRLFVYFVLDNTVKVQFRSYYFTIYLRGRRHTQNVASIIF